MGTLERALKTAAAIALAAMLAIYYLHGFTLLVWPDSAGYFQQAQGIVGTLPYARPGDRTLGYPLLLAAALALPRPMLTLVLFQAALTVAAFTAVYRVLTRVVLPRVELPVAMRGPARAVLLAGICSGTLYSVVHVQLASMLTETLFATLALLAVLAIVWLLLPGRRSRRPWLEAPLVAAVAAAPMLVKPHWLFASAVLALAAGLWLLIRSARNADARPGRRAAMAAASLLLPVLAIWLVGLPDRLLAQRYSPREHALFGPRTAFCTHARLMLATLAKRPALQFQSEPDFERDIRAELAREVASHRGGWGLLGFNSDLCNYSGELSALLDRRFPVPAEQSRFLLTSLLRLALADPLPYVRKVLAQLAAGFHTAFSRFAIDVQPGLTTYEAVSKAAPLPPDFLSGVRLGAELAPLGTRGAIHNSLAGRLVQAVLAIYFFALTGLFVGLVLLSLAAPAGRWRAWPPDVKANYLAFVAVPLAALLGHHLLVALVHTFDIWRYGFNAYFVNLLFVGAAGLFWWSDWLVWRKAA